MCSSQDMYTTLYGIARATYWKNGVPTTLAGPGQHTFANEIVVVNDDVYVVGHRHLGTFGMARLWKNGVEIPLSDDVRYLHRDGNLCSRERCLHSRDSKKILLAN